MILLNPGPVTLSPRVRQALAAEELCHREPEFAALTSDVLRRLEQVYECGADYAAVLLTGSGTCAVEAMLCTLAPRDRTTLVLCNGVYGERMLEMLKRQGNPVRALAGPWTDPLDPEAVRRELAARPEIASVAAVHLETTTGRLNRLDEIAELCRSRGASLLIDAVSSFGGEDLPLERWQPAALAATASKCLHGVPGISFVLARRDALGANDGTARSLYLDLRAYHREQANGWSPYTQAVQVVHALREALRELAEEGGWRARRSAYLARTTRVRDALRARGIAPIIPPEDCASMLSAFAIPEGDSYARLHDALKQRGYIIYAGQGTLAGRIFRIATMGSIGDDDMSRLVEALREVLRC
ncbi:MAG: 2-aminoethylphosphonate aminotransferase [Pseudomonadota bacterium]